MSSSRPNEEHDVKPRVLSTVVLVKSTTVPAGFEVLSASRLQRASVERSGALTQPECVLLFACLVIAGANTVRTCTSQMHAARSNNAVESIDEMVYHGSLRLHWMSGLTSSGTLMAHTARLLLDIHTSPVDH